MREAVAARPSCSAEHKRTRREKQLVARAGRVELAKKLEKSDG